MFENVNQPNQPQPNQPQPTPKEKDWGPWKPKAASGPMPPPPIDPAVREANAPIPKQNPNVNVPNNVNVPGGPGGTMPDLPQPNKRKYILIGIIIFSILVLLIAGAVMALNYFSNSNTNTENTNEIVNTNEVMNTNETVNTNANQNTNTSNINTTSNTNVNTANPLNINSGTNTNTLNSNLNVNGNINSNDNLNANVIVNSSTLDTDEDGLTDEAEDIYGTDRVNPDTDGDGYNDGDEIKNGYNPLCDAATAEADGCSVTLF